MSAGVSNQMKFPGKTAKNIDQSVPWTQVGKEASYEILSSSVNDDSLCVVSQNLSTQFQYPPFNTKEATSSSWNNKSRRSTAPLTSNYDSNKKYNKLAYCNNKRDDYQTNAWSSNNSRRSNNDNSSGNFNKGNRFDESRPENYSSEKLDNRPNVNHSLEDKKTTSTAAPKKTTWASIASQPAKLSSRATSTTFNHKKKGPGMPPPPMVPGKHNLDVNIWDLPNNNPPPVPSPPLPIDLGSNDINSDISPGIGADFDLNTHQDNGNQSKVHDVVRDENSKESYTNNFGRSRYSPNGHSRKNWSTQPSLHQGQGFRQSVHMRRAEGTMSGGVNVVGGGNVCGAGRYGERRGQNHSTRQDYDSGSYDYRDESISRNVEVCDTAIETPQAVLEGLCDKNNYNPAEIDLGTASSARFFVIKSYSEDDVHRSIKYEIWCSTDHGNKRLDDAFKERQKDGGIILLFFSVNGSGHFCGMAQMMTPVDYNSTSSVWSQDKWKGKFKVKWIYVKDVPNNQLRHITLENNENKPVTNSRDTQEVPNQKGIEVLQILHAYKHATSIFDDFYHYEKKQEEEVSSKKPLSYDAPPTARSHYNTRQNDDRDRDGRDGQRSGGGATHKYFASGSSLRDKNNSYRGGYSGYNDHRRFESYRCCERSDRSDRFDRGDLRDGEGDRENTEYKDSSRHMPKYDYNRRGDDRLPSKQNNRDREILDEQHVKQEPSRLRSGPRDIQKDNEYWNAERVRNNDY